MITRRQATPGSWPARRRPPTPGSLQPKRLKRSRWPSPRNDGGEPLLRALKLRRSTREYSDRKLPLQVLSD